MEQYSIYPGAYIPLMETETLLTELKKNADMSFAAPLMNMDEYGNLYRIEVGLPGISREDIVLSANENYLSVVVVHTQTERTGKIAGKVHEMNNTCFERNIVLPADADTEFIVAEFRNGLLCISVPKTNVPATRNHPIAVY